MVHYGRRGPSSIGRQAWMWAAILFVFGFVMNGVDNWAHLGGFLGGWAISSWLNPLRPERVDHVFAAVACLVLTAACDRRLGDHRDGAAPPRAVRSRSPPRRPMILAPGSLLAAIRRHAEAAYPEEAAASWWGAGGGPAGRRATGTPRVARALPAENVHRRPPPPLRHRPGGPAGGAEGGARPRGCDLVGYYHSHPDHPPRPSATDRRDAWPGVSYLIVAVAGGRRGRRGAGASGAEAAGAGGGVDGAAASSGRDRAGRPAGG